MKIKTLKILSIVAALALTFGVAQAPSQANTYASPTAPVVLDVVPAVGGVKVSWKPVTALPKVSHYIISGGPGSCPIMVPASKTSAVMPVLSMTDVDVKVQAVNEYGLSPAEFFGVPATPKSKAASTLKSVQLLQLSDFHGALETTSSLFGSDGLAGQFALERKVVPATIAMTSGDNFGAAPPISSQFEELPTIETLNAMKLDVATFGNHEHDRNLEHLRKMMVNSNFQWVVSNYSSLAGLKPTPAKSAKTFTIINKGGVKVGVIGVNTAQTKEQVFPGNLNFTVGGQVQEIEISASPAKVQSAIDAAKKAGADVVVGLIHEGFSQVEAGKATGPLVDYAKSLKGLGAIYGGHSHLTYNAVVNGVTVAQTRNAGAEYTRTQLCVDTKANKVIGSSVEVVTRASVPIVQRDAAVTAMVAGYKAQLSAKLDVKVGTVANRTSRGGSPAVERSGEQAFGSWLADYVKSKYKTDLVLLNGGGIRDTFPATTYLPADTTLRRPTSSASVTGPWDVTLGDAFTVNPFGNNYATTTITGTLLWAALENGVSNYPSDGRFPQVAGMKFTADVTKPKGERVTKVTLTDGTAIAKDSTVYTITTLDFIGYGGDGYTQFSVPQLQIRDRDADVVVEALRADMAAGKVTVMATDGRITIIK
jgi:5'-nucleotidase